MNLELLREGAAVLDFFDPDKVVLDAAADRALKYIYYVFDPFIDRSVVPVVESGTRIAKMIKYANNSFLAAKISLINDIGNICVVSGIAPYEVTNVIALDNRIGDRFLCSGVG